jgi:hypothetical protein
MNGLAYVPKRQSSRSRPPAHVGDLCFKLELVKSSEQFPNPRADFAKF